MAIPADLEIHTWLQDGTRVCIRQVRESDAAAMRAGIAKMSPRSRYLRFFSGATNVPEWVIERLVSGDGAQHLAWGAIAVDAAGEPAIGVVHAFRDADDPDSAEFSVGVLDEYHGLGLGKLLVATILLAARAEGLDHFTAETLAENGSAVSFVRSLGGELMASGGATRSWQLDVDRAIAVLRGECDPPGMAQVFEKLG